jgi:ABC-type lipoprotein release transport system permease subunit
MIDLKIAWRNLMRNRLRSLITLAGVSLSLALVQTYHNFTQGVYGYMVETGVRSGSGHIAIYKKNFLDDRDAALSFSAAGLMDVISRIKGVEKVLPRLYFSGLAQSSRENRNIQIMGVDLEKERAVNPFLSKLPQDMFSKSWQKQDALVGSELLQVLKIRLGQKFVITLQTGQKEIVSELFRVGGVIHTGIREIDASLVMLPWHRAVAMVGVPGNIHEIAVVLSDADMAPHAFPQIAGLLAKRPELEAITWEKAMPNLFNALSWDYVGGKILSYIVLLIVTIGVVNTLLMSVMERFHEFGMLRAMGTSPGRLCRMIMLEAFLLGTISMVAGTFVCSLATGYLVKYGFDLRLFIPENLEFGGVLFSSLLYARWDFLWMVQSGFYILALCLIASLYPAVKASRVTPVEALGHV